MRNLPAMREGEIPIRLLSERISLDRCKAGWGKVSPLEPRGRLVGPGGKGWSAATFDRTPFDVTPESSFPGRLLRVAPSPGIPLGKVEGAAAVRLSLGWTGEPYLLG